MHSYKTLAFCSVHNVVHNRAQRRAPSENQAFLSCAQWCARSCPPLCTTQGLAQGADPRKSRCAPMYSWHATTCYACHAQSQWQVEACTRIPAPRPRVGAAMLWDVVWIMWMLCGCCAMLTQCAHCAQLQNTWFLQCARRRARLCTTSCTLGKSSVS